MCQRTSASSLSLSLPLSSFSFLLPSAFPDYLSLFFLPPSSPSPSLPDPHPPSPGRQKNIHLPSSSLPHRRLPRRDRKDVRSELESGCGRGCGGRSAGGVGCCCWGGGGGEGGRGEEGTSRLVPFPSHLVELSLVRRVSKLNSPSPSLFPHFPLFYPSQDDPPTTTSSTSTSIPPPPSYDTPPPPPSTTEKLKAPSPPPPTELDALSARFAALKKRSVLTPFPFSLPPSFFPSPSSFLRFFLSLSFT